MKNKFFAWMTVTTVAAMTTFTLGFTNPTKEKTVSTVKHSETKVVENTIKQVKPLKVSAATKTVSKKQVTTFHKVKSDYLNVRSKNTAKSKIVDVLVKGYVVKVTSQNKGWSKLSSGGNVNSKYLTRLSTAEGNRLLAIQSKKPKPKPVFAKPKATKKYKSIKHKSSKKVYSGKPRVGVTTPSNVSGAKFEKIVSNTQLAGIGQAIAQVEKQYGINGFFTLAVAKLESGNGASRLARTKNNIFGMNAVDHNPYHSAFTYETKSHSVMDFGARLKKNYIDRGLTTLPAINAKYSTSSSWSTKVNQIMYGDLNKVY